MRDWLRRWLGIDAGTLIFEADGRLIVGCPVGANLTQSDASALRLRLDEWLRSTSGRVLVLPFPVTVVDKRPKE